MYRSTLPTSGKALHRVDRLCRDLSSLSVAPQKSEPVSRKNARRESSTSILHPKRRKILSSTPQASNVAAEIEEGADIQELKAQLLDSLYGVDRGLQAGTEVKAEISELISRLEANNPTPFPNEALELLSGTWRLVYTSNSELAPLLALGKIPGVTVGDIQQIIYDGSKIENKVSLNGPFFKTSFSTTASLDISSSKRLQVTFQEGCVSTPQLLQGIEFPDSTYVLGQYIDLRNLKDALHPVNAAVKEVADQYSDFSRRSSGLKFPIQSQQASGWLVNTFLDSDMRISRGDGGSIFVLVKDY